MVRRSSLRSVALVLLVSGVLLVSARAQTEHVLYSFCAQTNCADGTESLGGVVFDQKGNLYGTTLIGGADDHCGKFYDQGCGVVFKLAPGGKETILHSFCAQGGDYCTDGASPLAGLAFDQKGNLYGTAGGGTDDNGVVFKLTPEGKYTVFYRFCAQTDCTDGSNPWAGVVFDQKGNLYGTTSIGGAYGVGVVFKLTPQGKETVLYSFCAQSGCADGWQPHSGVVLDQKGGLYGTTSSGGANDGGLIFKLTAKGKYTVLHRFCAQNGCIDGAYPYAGVVFDRRANLYGTTSRGGAYGGGVVFKLTP
jgi:uncharacterized repeat protein (TIGR03803 family)